MTRARQALGAAGEALVASWYEARGYRVADRNWRCRDGELDLVLVRRREGLVVFCEVKTRSSDRFGSGLEAVTPVKQARLRRLASLYLADATVRPRRLRFDVASVDADVVHVVEDAF